jgi:hypothetical protein
MFDNISYAFDPVSIYDLFNDVPIKSLYGRTVELLSYALDWMKREANVTQF